MRDVLKKILGSELTKVFNSLAPEMQEQLIELDSMSDLKLVLKKMQRKDAETWKDRASKIKVRNYQVCYACSQPVVDVAKVLDQEVIEDS